MKIFPPDNDSGIVSRRVAATILACALIPLLALAIPPSWWSQRGVLNPDALADDYAPANLGQLKNMAKAAVEEMDARLPGGAGNALHDLSNSWATSNPQRNDFAPVNLGQLKNLAKPFYDRLIAVRYAETYPWTNNPTLTDDFALANLGQAKNLLSFDFLATNLAHDTDQNGLPDWWEKFYFGAIGVNPNADPDGDGISNIQEFQSGSDPRVIESALTLEAIPPSLDFRINLPEQQSQTLVLHNQGQRPLDFRAEAQALYYRFEDSNSPTGPIYQWDDISTTGIMLAIVSDSNYDYEELELPFNFPFFGETFTRVYVSSNGFVSFGAGSGSAGHRSLPSTTMPAGEIAAFQTSLDPASGGEIYYQHQTDRTLIQFQAVEHSDGSGSVTFQIVLERNGAVNIFYKSMSGTLDAATVGLQNLLQDQGVDVASNKPYVKDGLAVCFTREKTWLKLNPASGQIGPGQSVELTATAGGAVLYEGNYTGAITVASSGGAGALGIPVSAETNAAPTVELFAPQPGAGVLVGESVAVQAEASDHSGAVAKVEFYEGANLIGVAETEPYAVTWQPTRAGPYILVARAIDALGAARISPQLGLKVENDVDRDGLGDEWEMANFGALSQSSGGDFDGDGASNREEFQRGTAGNDHYNGRTPYPALLSRSRGASRNKVGMFYSAVGNSLRAYLRQIDESRLVGGNPESPVGGTVVTTVDPNTHGQAVERMGRPFTTGPDAEVVKLSPTRWIRRLWTPGGAEYGNLKGAYDDPPNLINDAPGTLEEEITLDNEYTTEQMIALARAALPPIPDLDSSYDGIGDDVEFATFRSVSFGDNDLGDIYLTQTNYKFKWGLSPNLPAMKKLTWLEAFYPNYDPRHPTADRTPITTVRTWEGIANETPTYYLSPSAPGRYSITTLPAELMVDGNRDEQMSFDDAVVHNADQTSTDKPYRFWLNDDDDTEMSPGEGGRPSGPAEVETVPALRKDCDGYKIASKRNLEDFSRLWIDLGYLQYEVLGGSIQVGLKWKTTESGEPAINIYPSEDGKGWTDYLTDDAAAARQIAGVFNNAVTDQNNKQTVNGNGTFIFKADYWTGVTTENSKKCLLFEGKSEGKGELAIVFLDRDGKEITTGSSVWIDLKSIKKMYERWTVGDGSGGMPAAVARLSTRDLPSGGSAFAYDDQGVEEKQYIVFVHGWNLEGRDKDAFAETAYKRLSWQGYRGRFVAYQWPTTYGFEGGIFDLVGDRENYDNGEFSAWRSALALSNLLGTLNAKCPGQVYLFGHSMGNVVSGEALRILGSNGKSINTYAACEAAVEASAYDPVIDTTFPLHFTYNHPSLPTGTNNYGPTTPNIYPNWLTSNSTGVRKKVSFYNVNDFALYEDFWEFDQISKPDNTGFWAIWGWDGVARPGSGDDLFWRQNNAFVPITPLNLGSTADIQDRYEIMSYAAEPRSRALGRTRGNIAGFTTTLDLRAIWPADRNNHRAREWHSGQFMQTNMTQGDFWASLLEEFGLSLQP
jgi:hypothetical protein